MKHVILTIDNAKSMYTSGIESLKELALNNYSKEELEAKSLPKSWGELKKFEGYYINGYSTIVNCPNHNLVKTNKNVFPTDSLATGALALAQLLQLRNAWWDGWKPDYNTNTIKYALYFNGQTRELIICNTYHINKIFVFKTNELAEDFKETFKDLLWEARELL